MPTTGLSIIPKNSFSDTVINLDHCEAKQLKERGKFFWPIYFYSV